MKFFLALAFAACVGAVVIKKHTVPRTEQAWMNDALVFGGGEQSSFQQCQSIGKKGDDASPAIKVCGTAIKVTAYLRNRCESYKQEDVGACDTKLDPATCVEFSPSNMTSFTHYQSYKVQYCNDA